MVLNEFKSSHSGALWSLYFHLYPAVVLYLIHPPRISWVHFHFNYSSSILLESSSFKSKPLHFIYHQKYVQVFMVRKILPGCFLVIILCMCVFIHISVFQTVCGRSHTTLGINNYSLLTSQLASTVPSQLIQHRLHNAWLKCSHSWKIWEDWEDLWERRQNGWKADILCVQIPSAVRHNYVGSLPAVHRSLNLHIHSVLWASVSFLYTTIWCVLR